MYDSYRVYLPPVILIWCLNDIEISNDNDTVALSIFTL